MERGSEIGLERILEVRGGPQGEDLGKILFSEGRFEGGRGETDGFL